MRLTRDQVHAVLKANPGATIGQLADLIGVSRKRVENHLYRLADAGLAHNRGSTHGGGRGRGNPGLGEWHAGERKRVASVWDLGA